MKRVMVTIKEFMEVDGEEETDQNVEELGRKLS